MILSSVRQQASQVILKCLSMLFVGGSLALFSQGVFSAEGDAENTVITSLPVTFALTSELLRGTSIGVRNLPERGRRINGQPAYFSSRAERLANEFSSARAVVTIAKLWREDALYTAARSQNIDIVHIDASKPWSFSLEGISIAQEPESNAPWLDAQERNAERMASLYFWLSPSNSARSADIIAGDLIRLWPELEPQIVANLASLRGRLFAIQRDFERKLAELLDLTVFALTPEFIYLTSDFGFYVDGYFMKQDLEWTEQDLQSFSAHLSANDIPVVLHKWQPEQAIVDAIVNAGARLVVLETIDAGIVEEGAMLSSSYFDLLEQNFEALYSAFSPAISAD